MKYNQKLNNTEDLTLKEEDIDISDCAKRCLQSATCTKGWVYNSAKKVWR